MGMFGGLVKAGIAQKIYTEARKPHNQAKAKELFSKVASKRGQGGRPQGPR
jgi:hypothetical protein